MSSEKFESCQDELDTQLERLSTELKKLQTGQGEAWKRTNQVCAKCLEDGDKLLDEMDSEARTAPLQYRAEMLAAVRSCRTQLSTHRASYRMLSLAGSRRAASDGQDRLGGVSADSILRDKVASGAESLARTGESIFRSQQVAIETEQVGEGIIDELGTQRESLERTRNRLAETDVELGRSRKILRRMYLNVVSNKIILSGIIIVEIGIIIGLVYWRFFS